MQETQALAVSQYEGDLVPRVPAQQEGGRSERGHRTRAGHIYIYIARVTHVIIEHPNSTKIIKTESRISYFLKMSITYSLVYVLADLSQDCTAL